MSADVDMIHSLRGLVHKWERVLTKTDQLLDRLLQRYETEIENVRREQESEQPSVSPMGSDGSITPPSIPGSPSHSPPRSLRVSNRSVSPDNASVWNNTPPQSNRRNRSLSPRNRAPANLNLLSPTLRESQKKVKQLDQVIKYLESLKNRMCTQLALSNRSSPEYGKVANELDQVVRSLASINLVKNDWDGMN